MCCSPPRPTCAGFGTRPAAGSEPSPTNWPGTAGWPWCSTRPSLPIDPAVNGACDLLGIDPLYVANEGKLVAVVGPDEADDAVRALRGHALGARAAVIGEVVAEPEGLVVLQTSFGGTRIVDMLVGDPLPRIC